MATKSSPLPDSSPNMSLLLLVITRDVSPMACASSADARRPQPGRTEYRIEKIFYVQSDAVVSAPIKMVSVAELTAKLAPLVAALTIEGRKNMATMAPAQRGLSRPSTATTARRMDRGTEGRNGTRPRRSKTAQSPMLEYVMEERFELLKSETVPLTRDLVEQWLNMKPSPTERELRLSSRQAFAREG